MNLTVNTQDIQEAIPLELLKAYSTTSEEGLAALNLVIYGNVANERILRDLLTDAIDNQYNYVRINRVNDEIIIYSFESISGYKYIVR